MRTIRKYPNRRLYDTHSGQFINLSDLRALVVSREDIRVEDKASGEDITRSLLLQIISEAEAEGDPVLSEHLLTDLICLHDHPMRGYLAPYLERSVALFMRQIEQAQAHFGDFMDIGPLRAWHNYTQDSLNWLTRLMGRSDSRPSDRDTDD